MHFVRAEHDAFQVFFYNRSVVGWEIEGITLCQQFLGSISVDDPEIALKNVPPVRATTVIVGESAGYAGD